MGLSIGSLELLRGAFSPSRPDKKKGTGCGSSLTSFGRHGTDRLRRVTPRDEGSHEVGLRGVWISRHIVSNLVEGSRNLAGLLPLEVRIFLGWELSLKDGAVAKPLHGKCSQATTRNGT